MADNIGINQFGEIIRGGQTEQSVPAVDIPIFTPPTQNNEPAAPARPAPPEVPVAPEALDIPQEPVVSKMDPEFLRQMQQEYIPEIYSESPKIVVDKGVNTQTKEEGLDLE